MRFDSNAKIVEYLAMIGFYELPLDYLDTFTIKVGEVSKGAIKEAFTRRLNVDDSVTIVVGSDDMEKSNL